MIPTTAARHYQVLNQFLNPIRDILTPGGGSGHCRPACRPGDSECVKKNASRERNSSFKEDGSSAADPTPQPSSPKREGEPEACLKA